MTNPNGHFSIGRATLKKHKRLTSKSTSTTNADGSVTVLEVCRCGAHRSVRVASGKVQRGEWGP